MQAQVSRGDHEQMTLVSVVVPCRNEQDRILFLLHALNEQTYPMQDMEVVIADAMSSDLTSQRIREFMQVHSDLRIMIIDNPQKTIPAGLNLALKAATGEIIVRLDAHSVPYPEYVSRCVQSIEAGRGDNVGGVWEIHPGKDTWLARGIAAAASHPLGVGDAFYRYAELPKLVDTVPFGSFRRQLLERIGYFDETLLTNEDYEFNVRLRKTGGKVWLDPEIRSIYYARSTIKELARQYWRYGYWKARMLRRYPETIRWRQALPPLMILGFVFLSLLSFSWFFAAWIFMIELLSYSIILLAAGFHSAKKKKDFSLMFSVPLAIATMHFSWGSAFIWSVCTK